MLWLDSKAAELQPHMLSHCMVPHRISILFSFCVIFWTQKQQDSGDMQEHNVEIVRDRETPETVHPLFGEIQPQNRGNENARSSTLFTYISGWFRDETQIELCPNRVMTVKGSTYLKKLLTMQRCCSCDNTVLVESSCLLGEAVVFQCNIPSLMWLSVEI
eukprot:6164659-Amphidinium_carterae.3